MPNKFQDGLDKIKSCDCVGKIVCLPCPVEGDNLCFERSSKIIIVTISLLASKQPTMVGKEIIRSKQAICQGR